MTTDERNGPWYVKTSYDGLNYTFGAQRLEFSEASFSTLECAQAECDRLNALETQSLANAEIADAARAWAATEPFFIGGDEDAIKKQLRDIDHAELNLYHAVRKHQQEQP